MDQSLVSEIHQTVLFLAETLIQPMQTICKESQTKPVFKSPLASLSKLPIQKLKKLRPSHPTDYVLSIRYGHSANFIQDFSANELQSESPASDG